MKLQELLIYVCDFHVTFEPFWWIPRTKKAINMAIISVQIREYYQYLKTLIKHKILKFQTKSLVKTEASYIERWFFCPYRLIKHFKTKSSLSKLQLRAPRAFQNKFPCVYAQRCKTSHVAQWVSRTTFLQYTHMVHNPRVLAWFLIIIYN